MQKVLLKNLFILLLGVGVLSSCREDEGVDSIFFRTDGSLSVLLTDDDGETIADARVELYNYETESRVSVELTNENGRVDFGRFETGVYSVRAKLNHSGDYFDFREEVHILSGVETTHEMNLADQRGDALIRFFNGSNGELIDFAISGIKIGVVPISDALNEITAEEEILDLVTDSYDLNGSINMENLPVAPYYVFLYNADGEIFDDSQLYINPDDKRYIDFYVDVLSLLLESKSNWTVSDFTVESGDEAGLIPVSTFSFGDQGILTANFNNGESAEANYSFYSFGDFYLSNLYSSSISCYMGEDYYELNNDGSLTLHFSYWETYNNSEYYYAQGVALTLK